LSSETKPFYYWTENDRFKEAHLDSFDVSPGQVDNEQGDEGGEEDSPQQILCVYTGSRGTKGEVWHTLSRVEHSHQHGMNVQNGDSITALGRCSSPSGFFASIEEENE